MNQKKQLEAVKEVTSMILSSGDVVYASEEEEFFYENTNEPVPYGEPIGMDVPVYDFDFIKYDVDKDDDSRDADKWRYNANQEYEALINDWLSPREVELVLFKNVYWKPHPETKHRPKEEEEGDYIF
jgi:hypothetical protein